MSRYHTVINLCDSAPFLGTWAENIILGQVSKVKSDAKTSGGPFNRGDTVVLVVSAWLLKSEGQRD